MAPARPGLIGSALGSLAILALVAFIAVGLPLLDDSLPSARTLAAGARFSVGAGVSLVPPSNCAVDLSRTRPGSRHGTALFVLGAVRYAVVVDHYRGDLRAAAARVRRQITELSGYQVTAEDRPVRTNAGVEGRSGGYDSPGRTGRYAVFVSGTRAVEMTASGPVDALRAALPAVEASVRTVAFAPGS